MLALSQPSLCLHPAPFCTLQHYIINPARKALPAPALSPAGSAKFLKPCGTHVASKNNKKKKHSSRRRSSGGGAPTDKVRGA
jgi:hypothetical protein